MRGGSLDWTPDRSVSPRGPAVKCDEKSSKRRPRLPMGAPLPRADGLNRVGAAGAAGASGSCGRGLAASRCTPDHRGTRGRLATTAAIRLPTRLRPRGASGLRRVHWPPSIVASTRPAGSRDTSAQALSASCSLARPAGVAGCERPSRRSSDSVRNAPVCCCSRTEERWTAACSFPTEPAAGARGLWRAIWGGPWVSTCLRRHSL
jgi:hypothetical protein